MLKADEEAFICDMAETYHVLDYKALPAKTAALLASGLRDNSRIKMKISGQKAASEVLLLAAAVDRLGLLLWMNTEDGHKNRNRPKLIAEQFIESKKEIIAFETIAAFEKRRQEILKKGGTTWQQN